MLYFQLYYYFMCRMALSLDSQEGQFKTYGPPSNDERYVNDGGRVSFTVAANRSPMVRT